MEVIKILKKLVSYNTVEDLQNNEIVQWIEEYLTGYGFKCKKVIDKETKKVNLVANIGKNPILAFSGHLDTVSATEGWNTDPFKLKVDGSFAYGLGVCDMKGRNSCIFKSSKYYRYQ